MFFKIVYMRCCFYSQFQKISTLTNCTGCVIYISSKIATMEFDFDFWEHEIVTLIDIRGVRGLRCNRKILFGQKLVSWKCDLIEGVIMMKDQRQSFNDLTVINLITAHPWSTKIQISFDLILDSFLLDLFERRDEWFECLLSLWRFVSGLYLKIWIIFSGL